MTLTDTTIFVIVSLQYEIKCIIFLLMLKYKYRILKYRRNINKRMKKITNYIVPRRKTKPSPVLKICKQINSLLKFIKNGFSYLYNNKVTGL